MAFQHKVQRHLVAGLAGLALGGVMQAPAWAAAVSLTPSNATIALDATLQALLAFAGATTQGVGGASVAAGSFSAAVGGATVPGITPGPLIVNWAPEAGLSFGNAAATFTFTGFRLDVGQSEVYADLHFVSSVATHDFQNVAFLSVSNLTGQVGDQALTWVAPSSQALPLGLRADLNIDLVGLAPVIQALGITSLPVAPGAVVKAGVLTVSPVAVVPEPSTAVMGALSLLGLGWLRRVRTLQT
jgi:hypothetical protein